MFFLYEVLFHIALVIGFPVLWLRPRLRDGLDERTGNWTSMVFERLAGGPVVWIHCASVGEVQAARPLVSELMARHPAWRFLVTTMTVTGRKQAQDAFGKRAAVALLPFDSALFLRRVFARVKPRCLFVFETELWPQFLRMAKAAGAQLYLVNGRISERSFPRYMLLRGFFARLLELFDGLYMCDELSAARIKALGAPRERVVHLGNVKWGAVEGAVTPRTVPGWSGDAPVLLAGSTHPGEEELVLKIFEDLRQYHPQVRLVLAPRHPQRTAEVEQLLKSAGLAYAKRTGPGEPAPEVYLLDTVGELRSFFPLADVVFLGGSLVAVGGHNVLEPAAAGVPVVYGPYMQNFADIAGALEAHGGSLRVEDWRSAAKAVRDWLADALLRKRMGEAGKALVAENRAIYARYVETFDAVLRSPGQPV